jgi:hypothetical protein
MDCLSLTDLFLVGLVLDVTGAYILAKGLLVSPQRVRELMATHQFGGEATPGVEESHFQNRIDAEIGVAYIALGFMFQVVGYVLELGGVHSASGTTRLLVGIGLALAALTAALVGWKILYPIRLRWLENRVIQPEERLVVQGD